MICAQRMSLPHSPKRQTIPDRLFRCAASRGANPRPHRGPVAFGPHREHRDVLPRSPARGDAEGCDKWIHLGEYPPSCTRSVNGATNLDFADRGEERYSFLSDVALAGVVDFLQPPYLRRHQWIYALGVFTLLSYALVSVSLLPEVSSCNVGALLCYLTGNAQS